MNDSIVTVTEGKRFPMMIAPMERDGKYLVYQEIFRSNHHEPVKRLAEKHLNSIREGHRKEYGWYEIDAWLEHYPDGYVACRYHAQYR